MNIIITDIMMKMLQLSEGNLHDIEHFLKVYAYAKTIGESEGLSLNQQEILEAAAIVHDISCPLCRMKYGSTAGHLQEKESVELCGNFFEEFELDEKTKNTIIEIVSKHHTYSGVKLIEHRILLEADFLVNASEMGCCKEQILAARESFFRTETGIKLLDNIYLCEERK